MLAIADKFAKVLFAQSPSKDYESILDSLNYIKEAISKNQKLKFILESPSINIKRRVDIIFRIAKTLKAKLHPNVINLLVILVSTGNLKAFNTLITRFMILLDKFNKITETTLIFADKPSDQEIKNTENILKEKYNIKPKIHVKTDESIIAGFVAFFDGKRLDASAKGAFEDLFRVTKSI